MQQKIIEVFQIVDLIGLIPVFDVETWVLVDIDNTLFEAAQALGHSDWFEDEIRQRMQKGMNRQQAVQDFYPEWIKIQRICPVKPLESDFISFIVELQNKGIKIMGFTQRQVSIAEETICQVKSLGIDFTITAPSTKTFTIPAQHPVKYTHGILFVGDFNNKGDMFLPFLSFIDQKPRKIALIDDKKKNIDEMEKILTKEGTEYFGIHYRAIECVDPIYDHKIAQLQYKYSDKIIISNEAALLLMKDGAE